MLGLLAAPGLWAGSHLRLHRLVNPRSKLLEFWRKAEVEGTTLPPSKLGHGEKGVLRVGDELSVMITGLPLRVTGAMRDLLSSAPIVMSPPARSCSIFWAIYS